MKLTLKHSKIFFFLFLIFLESCNVKTSPSEDLKYISQTVYKKTGHSIETDLKGSELLIQNYLNKLLEKKLTEESAIKIALLNNKHLKATYERIGYSKAILAQAKLLKNPIFSLSYKFATKSGQFDIINLNLFQNFLDALLIPSKKKLAETELQKTKALVTNQVLQTIANAKKAFYDVLVTQMSLELEKKILLASEAAYEFAEVLFDAGNITSLELMIKKTDYAEEKIRISDLEVALIQAKEDLNQIMGIYGEQINWEVSNQLNIETLSEFCFDNLENKVISKNLDLKYQQLEMITLAKKYGIDIANTVMSNFTIGPDSEREDDGVWFVGPAFSIGIPIFDFGKAISAAAQAELYQQFNNYTALAVDIRSATRMARINFLNSKRKANYYERVIITLKEEIHKKAFEQYNAMQIGTFELLQTKINEIRANIQKLSIQNDLISSRIQLDLLISGGSEMHAWNNFGM